MKTVWVIMSNDYPDSVFSNAEDAIAYVTCMEAAEKKKDRGFRRIYWRSYEFEVEGKQ